MSDSTSRTAPLRVLVYSRWGYGKSEAIAQGPRLIDYMNPEGREVLPQLLRQLGVTRPILLGHSDGGSIALMRSTRGYVELSRWDRVVEVPAKPVALTRVLNHEADWAIVSLAQYQANEARLELAEQIGPVECGWLVYAARGRVPEGVLAPAENWSPAGGRA